MFVITVDEKRLLRTAIAKIQTMCCTSYENCEECMLDKEYEQYTDYSLCDILQDAKETLDWEIEYNVGM